MATNATEQRFGLDSSDEAVVITRDLIEQFLNVIKAGGRQPQTIGIYRRSLEDLYDSLPEEKEITQEVLEAWKESLKQSGYSDNTVNTKLAAINCLLRFCGVKGLHASYNKIQPEDNSPELTRQEYLRLLSAASRMGKEREYFLIKVFACIDLGISELDFLTVEACKEGVIRLPDRRQSFISDCLSVELLQYASRHGIESGRIFVTKDENSLNRSNITNALHKLAEKAGMEPEKCNPRALQRVYQATQEELIGKLRPVYLQSYDNLLKAEQAEVAWDIR